MKDWPCFFSANELQPSEPKKGLHMKSWHIGVVVAVLIGYALGILFPAVGQSLKSKLGV